MPLRTSKLVNRSHPLNRGRAAWWLILPHLASGPTWTDLMGSYNGTLTSMANASNGWRAATRPGVLGGGIATDGTGGKVDFGTIAGLNGATRAVMAAWLYKASNTTSAGFGGINGGTAGGGYRFSTIWYTDGNLYTSAESAVVGYGYCPVAVGWRRVMFAYDGSGATNAARLQVFIDGIPQSLTFSGSIATALSNTCPVVVGQDSLDRYDAGLYDDVSVWLGLPGATAPALASLDYDLSRRGYPGVLNRY